MKTQLLLALPGPALMTCSAWQAQLFIKPSELLLWEGGPPACL